MELIKVLIFTSVVYHGKKRQEKKRRRKEKKTKKRKEILKTIGNFTELVPVFIHTIEEAAIQSNFVCFD